MSQHIQFASHSGHEVYAVYHAVDPDSATQPRAERWLLDNGLNYAKVAQVQAPLDEDT